MVDRTSCPVVFYTTYLIVVNAIAKMMTIYQYNAQIILGKIAAHFECFDWKLEMQHQTKKRNPIHERPTKPHASLTALLQVAAM